MVLVNIYKIPTLKGLVFVHEVADDALGSRANIVVMFLSIRRNAGHRVAPLRGYLHWP